MTRRSRRALVLLAGAGAAAAVVAWLQFAPLPAPVRRPAWARAVFAENGELLDVRIAADGQWRLPVSPSEMSGKYVRAVLAFEDRRFFFHPGLDPLALARAFVANLRAGRVVSGASTLTMQLARLLRGNPRRTGLNKLREAALALQLEWRFTKPEILALYATHAPFGGNLVGLHAASWRYLGRAPGDLSWAEAALFAVLPNSPGLLHPGRNRSVLQAKRDRLLAHLRARQLLGENDYRLALAEPLPPGPRPWPSLAPHLLQRLVRDRPGEPLFRSTVDPRLQRELAELLARHGPALAAEGVRNTALVVVDHERMRTAAYVGNSTRDPAGAPDVDIADSPRSTGSILKPLLYGLMLQEGEILPATLVPDIPTNFGGYMPENHDSDYRGAVPAREALAQSLNVPAVRMLERYGVERFRNRLRAFGFKTFTRSARTYGLSLILGGGEARLRELTEVYAALTHVAAHPDEPALVRRAALLEAAGPGAGPGEFPLRAGAAWLVLQAMIDVARPGGESRWRDYEDSQVIAWKTGTSYGLRDGWAIGSNGRYTAGVWTGNADGSAAAALGGARSAGPILMEAFGILGRSPWIGRPAGALQDALVCEDDGYLAARGCRTAVVQAPRGSQFAAPSPNHRTVFLSADGRHRVHGACEQPSRMRPESWFVLPPAQAYFWKRRHSEYRSLPPWRPDCIASLQQAGGEAPFELLYPPPGSRIHIPLELSGLRGGAVFRALHSDPQAVLYWHLDSTYLGETRMFHERLVRALPGRHSLVLVDQTGRRLERGFSVMDPERRGAAGTP